MGLACRALPNAGDLVLSLEQTDRSVRGTLQLASFQGTVEGEVRADNALLLTGQGGNGSTSARLTAWESTSSGTALGGTFTLLVTSDDVPLGRVTISAVLAGVVRTP